LTHVLPGSLVKSTPTTVWACSTGPDGDGSDDSNTLSRVKVLSG